MMANHYKICNGCKRKATVGNICDACGKFFCENCDSIHMMEHMHHWDAE